MSTPAIVVTNDFKQKFCELIKSDSITWSDWVTVMVPTPPDTELMMTEGGETLLEGKEYEKRPEDNVGYFVKNWEEDPSFGGKLKSCGIYEFKLVNVVTGEEKVVMIDSSHFYNSPFYSMKEFISEYVLTGSLKKAEINEALFRDNLVQVRIFATQSDCHTIENKLLAENMKEELMEQYEYPWNNNNEPQQVY